MTAGLLSASGIAVALGACSSAPPPVVVAPPVVEAPKPPPVRAHWVFPPGRRTVKAQLAMAGGARLYVGMDGLRQVVRGNGEPVEAPTIGLDDFLGVLKDDKEQIVFLAVNGDTFVASDPLAALAAPRPGPLHGPRRSCDPGEGDACFHHEDAFTWVTTGRAAMLGITHDKRVLRSADYGASWQEVASGGPKSYGRPAAIELDLQGNGLLLRYPQRVLVTHDDGATWAPIASPGFGAREIRRDGDDRLWLIGFRGSARLEGNALGRTTSQPSPLVRPSDRPDRDQRSRSSGRTLLCGERSVEISEVSSSTDSRAIAFGAAPLGDKLAKPAEHVNLVGEGLSSLVACYGSDMVYLRTDNEPDSAARTSTVFRSKDWGVTWAEESKLIGTAPREAGDTDVTVGPDGFTYIADLCPGPSPDDNECSHRQIRPAKAAAFEDMSFTEEFAPKAFAFDRDHDRVYVVGLHDTSLYLYESPLTQNHFTRIRRLVPYAYAHFALTVDASGTVRTLLRDDAKRAWVLERRPFGGEALPPLYIPLGDGPIAFAGERGLLFSDHGDGWETADGGQAWTRTTRVATNGLRCSIAGCMDDDGSERVGWDLPALAATEVVTALAEPPPAPSEPAKPAAVAPEPPVDLVCKPSGAPTTIGATPGNELVDSRGEVRWATVKREADSKTSVVFGTKSGVQEARLLGPAPKPPAAGKPAVPGQPVVTITSGDRLLNDGVVAARYRVTKDRAGQETDVELAWWSAASGKTRHHELKKVPTFYTASYNTFNGTPQIVDGGLLYQPASGRDVYFLKDDGGVETFSIPYGAGIQSAERVGKSWVLLDAVSGNAGVWWSTDGAKSWVRDDWGLEQTGRVSMALLEGKPTLAYASRSQPDALFAIGAAPTEDPPAPVVVHLGQADAPCSARVATLRDVSYVPYADRRLRARVELVKNEPVPAGRLTIGYRVTHVTADGTGCTSALIFSGSDPKTNDSQTSFLYPDAKGYSGWWFHRAPDPKDAAKRVLLAAPLTCEKGLPEKH